jgi:thiol-disulfide isomerase/thioredoxin
MIVACLTVSSTWSAGRGPRIAFGDDLEAALAQAKADGKPVMVAWMAAWCPLCREMKRKAFRDPAVVEILDRFVTVLVDIDRSFSLAKQYDVAAVPEVSLFDAAGNRVERLEGLMSGADLREHLERFLQEQEEGTTAPAEPVVEVHGPLSSLIETPKGYRGKSICFSNVGYGPLNLASQSPLQSLRLGIRPRTPSTLTKGQFNLRGTATWVNIWGNEDDHFLDYEMLEGAVALGYGITDTLEIEGQLANRSRFGGRMDALVQGFHDLFGVDQSGRDEVPKDQFSFHLEPGDSRPDIWLENKDRGSFARSLQVTVQHNVTCGTPRTPAFSYSFTAQYELDSADLTGSDLGLGASVAISRRFGAWYVYGTLGYSWFGSNEFRGLELESTQFTLLAAGEWRFLPRQSFLLQYLATEGLVKDFSSFSEISHEVTVGWKWEIILGQILEVGLVENIITFDNSPDFGFHAGYSWRF